MHARLAGSAVALLSLVAFCWRGWPLRTVSTSTWRLAGGSSLVVFHVHYLLCYLLVSVAAGLGAAWLVRRFAPSRLA